jgi:hypothetical protein
MLWNTDMTFRTNVEYSRDDRHLELEKHHRIPPAPITLSWSPQIGFMQAVSH